MAQGVESVKEAALYARHLGMEDPGQKEENDKEENLDHIYCICKISLPRCSTSYELEAFIGFVFHEKHYRKVDRRGSGHNILSDGTSLITSQRAASSVTNPR